MSKMIIENRSSADDLTALSLVCGVIDSGRISNGGKQYCYATRFEVSNCNYLVTTDLNKQSDRFVVSNCPSSQK